MHQAMQPLPSALQQTALARPGSMGINPGGAMPTEVRTCPPLSLANNAMVERPVRLSSDERGRDSRRLQVTGGSGLKDDDAGCPILVQIIGSKRQKVVNGPVHFCAKCSLPIIVYAPHPGHAAAP